MNIFERFKNHDFIVNCRTPHEEKLFLTLCSNYGIINYGANYSYTGFYTYSYYSGLTQLENFFIIERSIITFTTFLNEYCKEFGNSFRTGIGTDSNESISYNFGTITSTSFIGSSWDLVTNTNGSPTVLIRGDEND